MIDRTFQDIRQVQRRSAKMLHAKELKQEKVRIRKQYSKE